MGYYPESIPRCQHIKVNGTQCGSPALRNKAYCYFHKRWQEQRIHINSGRARKARAALDLPVLEDANSIQVALMQVMRLLISAQIDHKTASLLLYALQTASSNLRKANFEPSLKTEVVIDPREVADTPLGQQPWHPSQFEDEEEDEEEEAGTQEGTGVEIQAMAAPPSRASNAPVRAAISRKPPAPDRTQRNPSNRNTGATGPSPIRVRHEKSPTPLRPRPSNFVMSALPMTMWSSVTNGRSTTSQAAEKLTPR